MTPGTIFISHRAEYGSLVKELKKAIETTSRGQIRIFISEELRGAEDWREAIKKQLADAQSLFLVYGAPHEDWTWCFYEAGYFAGIDVGKQPRRIYCISRPNVPAPGPLSELQMVTDIEGLLKDLMDIYDENKVGYNPVQLRQSISAAGRLLFRQLEEFVGYPRVYFVANDSDFATAELPAGTILKGDKVLLTQLFGIGKDAVPWDEITKSSGDDRTSQEQMFFCKWLEETKKIILAAREHKFKAPQTVLIARAGLRVRFLLYQARVQGDGSYCCEFLVINEVGGPALGLPRQLLALATSIRMALRFRYELIRHFGNEPDSLSDVDRRARIQEMARIIENLTTESESRGNITLEDLQGAFEEDEADRIGKLVGYWPFLQTLLFQTLLRDERVGSSFEGCVRWIQRRLRLGLAELGFWTRRNAPRPSENWRWPKRTIRSTLRLTLPMRPCCLVRLLLRPRSRSRRRTMPRLRKTCCRRSGGVGLRALAVRTAVGTTFAPGARLAASLGTAARVAGRHSTR